MIGTENLLDNDDAKELTRSEYFRTHFDLVETRIYALPPILFYSKLYGGEVKYFHGGTKISVYEKLLDDLILSITFQSMIDEHADLKESLKEFFSSSREFSYLIDTEVGDGEFRYPFLDLLTEHISRNLRMVNGSKIRSFEDIPDLDRYIYINSKLVKLYEDESRDSRVGYLLSRFEDMLFIRIIKEI